MSAQHTLRMLSHLVMRSGTSFRTRVSYSPALNVYSVFHLTVALIGDLSTSIESKLPVAQLDIDPWVFQVIFLSQYSPIDSISSTQLENVKAKTSGLYDDAFCALMDLLKLAQSYHSKLLELRFKVTDNELMSNSKFEDERESFKLKGITIIHKFHGIISWVWCLYSSRPVAYDVSR